MTDAPFTETHRTTLERLREGDDYQPLSVTLAAAAALAEIERLKQQHGAVVVEAATRLAVLREEIDRLRQALVAARQFLPPDVPRGEDVNGWHNTVTLVNEALGEMP